MSMPISHPWLAPRSLRIGRREGGTQTREERSPSWCADEGSALMDERGWWRDSLSRKLLGASGLLAPEIARRFVPRVGARRAGDDSEWTAGA